MLIKGESRASALAICLAAAPDYHLKEAEAAALITDRAAGHDHRRTSESDLRGSRTEPGRSEVVRRASVSQ
ncbi:hypothetical protein NGR_b07610 (plasmid) [Sinorhizobium fredii NGR234]|uniref:Uncharacterized protein n=1 Tax=Sinorhizobium fredii (strain NBRC 101917 / NGR234) TaxID=394 RepID=C3KQ61_SINFN|nr:hypothetical protein NGR_b07610 [Sinorhizobium fredii NGR234]